jgi:hypothetical protein
MDALSACNAVTRLLSDIDALTCERDAAVLAEREACGAFIERVNGVPRSELRAAAAAIRAGKHTTPAPAPVPAAPTQP